MGEEKDTVEDDFFPEGEVTAELQSVLVGSAVESTTEKNASKLDQYFVYKVYLIN